MGGHDRILSASRVTVRVFLLVNLVCIVGFVAAILLSFPVDGWIVARLVRKYGPALNVRGAMLALRMVMVWGVVAGAVLHRIFTQLLAILATVRRGDPFTTANAGRLRAIAWAMLALQGLDLVQGAMTAWFAALHVQFVSWSPAFGGWIAVLLLFVLAQVFARGAEMRDELAATV
ncbi:DUF2975 domain-containing protein [Sphingomonas sp.]|uniref:DUF2975 domain-containing protein n=1 Tax=Sphingomonas sp. TaxID=28214 RepID=UPI00356531E4